MPLHTKCPSGFLSRALRATNPAQEKSLATSIYTQHGEIAVTVWKMPARKAQHLNLSSALRWGGGIAIWFYHTGLHPCWRGGVGLGWCWRRLENWHAGNSQWWALDQGQCGEGARQRRPDPPKSYAYMSWVESHSSACSRKINYGWLFALWWQMGPINYTVLLALSSQRCSECCQTGNTRLVKGTLMTHKWLLIDLTSATWRDFLLTFWMMLIRVVKVCWDPLNESHINTAMSSISFEANLNSKATSSWWFQRVSRWSSLHVEDRRCQDRGSPGCSIHPVYHMELN